MREGGVITFLSRKLFVTQYQKMSLGNTSVSENLGYEKFYASERGEERERERERERDREGGVSRFSVENFLSHSSDKILGEHFCVSKDFWYRIFEAKEGKLHGFVENFFI